MCDTFTRPVSDAPAGRTPQWSAGLRRPSSGSSYVELVARVDGVTDSVSAIRGLARASRLLERASGDLSLAHYRVLAAIASGDERASRIADRLALGKPTISASVEALRQRGLLTRTGVDADQRAASLRLTAQGQLVLEAAEGAMTERLDRLAARTPDPQAVLQALVWLDAAIEEFQAEQGVAR